MEYLQGIIQNSGLITVGKLSHPLGLYGREMPDRTWDKANPPQPGRQETERITILVTERVGSGCLMLKNQ